MFYVLDLLLLKLPNVLIMRENEHISFINFNKSVFYLVREINFPTRQKL